VLRCADEGVNKARKAALLAICSGLGTGYSPVAPGTFGSLVGLVAGVLLWRMSMATLLVGIAAVTVGGYFAIRAVTEAAEADADPGWIVIDEVAGQMLTLAALSRLDWRLVALAFGLFRLFDVAKPGPVGWADRHGGASGIMLDDLIAGLCATLVLAGLQAVLV
jgi:phosphatidylglycerophosphatase A